MDRQPLEPRCRARALSLGGVERRAVGKLVHRIELAALLDFLLDEAAAVPRRAFEQDRQVLELVPGEEFDAEVFRCPQSDVKQPVAALPSVTTTGKEHRHLLCARNAGATRIVA